MTIHSTLGLGVSSNLKEGRKFIGPNTLAKAQDRLRDVSAIVVDEVSMLTGDYLDMVDWWLNLVSDHAPGQTKPFGGFQIILVGDMLQLPPVIRDPGEVAKKYAFQSDAWRGADIEPVYLTECFRTEDPDLFKHLNRIRRGVVNDETMEYFRPCVGRQLTDPTRLYPTNQQAFDYNTERLDALPGEPVMFEASFDGNSKWWPAMQDNCIAEEVLSLKVGAPVLFLKNNRALGYVNGMRGTVIAFHDDDAVEVEVTDQTGAGRIMVRTETWEMKDANERLLASMTQFPLKLAWAVTVHKSQGMSLDLVECDLSRCFERGQAYVALSRARRHDGLSLSVPLRRSNVRASKQCVDYYAELRAMEAAHG